MATAAASVGTTKNWLPAQTRVSGAIAASGHESGGHVPRLVISTDGIATFDRVDIWRERTAQIAFPLTLRECADGQLLIVRPLGSIVMIDINCRLIERSHSDIAKKPGDCIVIACQRSGETQLQTGDGREAIALRSGDAAVVDPDQPFIHASRNGILRAWIFPSAVLRHVPTLLQDGAGVMHLSGEGPAKLVRTFIEELGSQIDRLHPVAAEAFAGQAARILSIALSSRLNAGQGESACNCPASARLLRLHHAIERRLTDPLLSVARIAADCGISSRTVHYVFGSSGTTFANYVLDRRLGAARAALANPRNAFASISDLAFACGFNSLSNFHQRYRERFEEAPGRCCQSNDNLSLVRAPVAAGCTI